MVPYEPFTDNGYPGSRGLDLRGPRIRHRSPEVLNTKAASQNHKGTLVQCNMVPLAGLL